MAVLAGYQQLTGSVISNSVAKLDRKITESEEAYQDAIQGRTEELGLRDCWREVDATYQGIDTAAAEVRAALSRADLALVQFRNDQGRLRQVLLDSRAACRRGAPARAPLAPR